jgi:hypothetical protein
MGACSGIEVTTIPVCLQNYKRGTPDKLVGRETNRSEPHRDTSNSIHRNSSTFGTMANSESKLAAAAATVVIIAVVARVTSGSRIVM